MQPDGQIYADWDGGAPMKDIERYEKAHRAEVAEEARRVLSQMNELERMLRDAEAR